MPSEQVTFTGAGRVILVVCTIIGIVAALLAKEAMGYDGILWGAIFGGVGGGIGGAAGTIIAKLAGQIRAESSGRSFRR